MRNKCENNHATKETAMLQSSSTRSFHPNFVSLVQSSFKFLVSHAHFSSSKSSRYRRTLQTSESSFSSKNLDSPVALANLGIIFFHIPRRPLLALSIFAYSCLLVSVVVQYVVVTGTGAKLLFSRSTGSGAMVGYEGRH